jgi:hypothetical protein
MESVLKTTESVEADKKMVRIFRYKGCWYRITPKPWEPETQTWFIAFNLAKGLTQVEAYRLWFEERQKQAKLLYPDFRK